MRLRKPGSRLFDTVHTLMRPACSASFHSLVRVDPSCIKKPRWNAFGERRGAACCVARGVQTPRSEEHTSELPSLMRISYAVFCLKKKKMLINRPQRKSAYIE